MKRFLNLLIGTNILFSIYLIINKWILEDTSCKTCSHLPISQLQLSIMAFIGSLTVAILYRLSLKIKTFGYACAGFTGVTAIVSASLMALQFRQGYIICWSCFASEVMFYITFVVLAIQRLSSWLRQQWSS